MPATSSTSSSDRRLLLLVRVLGAIAAVAFLGVRFPSATELLTAGAKDLGGDLYQQVRVRDFREPLPPDSTTPAVFGAPPESAEVVLIGDSHSRFARGGPSLASMLRKRYPGLRACAVTAIHPRFFDPSDLLRLQGGRPGTVKVVVWESAERAVADVAMKKIPQPFHAWDTTWMFDAVQTGRMVKEKWFTGSEGGYQYLLLNSVATRDVVELWNTARFGLVGTLPPSIGAWIPDPPRLFLAEELARTTPPPGEYPTSFLQKRDSALVEAMASSLAEARDRLRRDFGAELVFVVVPAKSSLLHASLGLAYDDFIPRLEDAVAARGIRAIRSWDALSRMGERATIRTETHLSADAYAALTDSIHAAAGGILAMPSAMPIPTR